MADNSQTRRATIDDVAELRRLWRRAGFAVEDVEKALIEFQIVESPTGILLGCLGLRLDGRNGWLHHEAYADGANEKELRKRLWERVLTVARNHGLLRLWTQSTHAFWKSAGFVETAPRTAGSPPPGLLEASPKPWQLLALREEPQAESALEREFELFKQTQKNLTDRAFRQARILRWIAGIIAVAGFAAILFFALKVMRRMAESF